jgi:hypothetical protein
MSNYFPDADCAGGQAQTGQQFFFREMQPHIQFLFDSNIYKEGTYFLLQIAD